MINKRELIKLSLLSLSACASANTATLVAPTINAGDIATNQYVKDLRKRTFDFFWKTTNSKTGLTPDRWPNETFSSIAAVGFALNAYCIGAEHGYVTREEAAQRTLNTLKFIYEVPQGEDASGKSGAHGFYYHFLNYSDGTRYKNCELSSIDTTLYVLGALFAKEYFDKDNEIERQIRDFAQKTFDRIDWGYLTRPSGLLGMGWHPETGFIKSEWTGYSEGILCYLLGLGSTTYPMKEGVWSQYCSTYDRQWGLNSGPLPHVGYFSLAVHQLPNIWYDMRDIADEYMAAKKITYFENARRATLAERAYAAKNPMHFNDYSQKIWGFTACDGPFDGNIKINGVNRFFRSYSERGQGEYASFDDGTIAPTAAISSIMLTPDESLEALISLREKYGDDIYGEYGFFDSFNPSFITNMESPFGTFKPKAKWVSFDYLGIDQGPIIAGIENATSGLIRDKMRGNKIVQNGLKRAGFTPINSKGSWING